MIFTRSYPNGNAIPTHGLWLAVSNMGVLVTRREGETGLPFGDSPLPHGPYPENVMHLGHVDGHACLACSLDEKTALPPAARFMGLRDLFGRIPETHYAIAGYATQMLLWQRQSNFCSVCGAKLLPMTGEWGKRCEHCHHVVYPPVSPCIITLIHDGDRALLTHKEGWGNRYGLVAGFVEPGESLEDCLRREVKEEVGAYVTDITYYRSQPWPFPHQIMVGFFARFSGGDVKPDPYELDEVRWTTVDEIVSNEVGIPPKLSIARQLIDHWVDQYRQV
jgi:NAD+ diphosphatase